MTDKTRSRPHPATREVDMGTVLSVCIPTYKRPHGLAQALRSVTAGGVPGPEDIEVLVSDNGGPDAALEAAAPFLRSWPGPTRHIVHDPPVGMVGNFNACWRLSSGDWVLILHDDDYLIGSGLGGITRAIRRADDDEHVLLFGVDVVDEHGRRRHRQVARRHRRLAPAAAVEWLISDSSSVRFPAMVVRRTAYEQVGGFDPDMANMTDYDMWLRLFARFGLTRIPETTAAYVVHSQAATEELFSPFGVTLLDELFARVDATGLLPTTRVRALKRDYLHKFLLAGTLRRLQRRQWVEAREILALLGWEPVARLGWSPRWAPVRAAAQALLTASSPFTRGRTTAHR